MSKKQNAFRKVTENKEMTVTVNENPTLQRIPGDSVDKYSILRSANLELAEKEIGQQMENN
ncbi:hypothetical protein ACIQXU_00995 [Peribacillus sp. NPDC097284]|uniref:hypothetical protein n=1 Tax=Peribacillus sp. NPDC097284 TaxID=3364401 RepID=UPI003829B19D